MQKAVKFFAGNVEVQVSCPYPERFINMCAKNSIDFWELTRVDDNTLQMKMSIGGYNAARDLSLRNGFAIKPVRKIGMPFFLWCIRKRYALLVGMVLCLAAVWFSSFFIWEMEVSGNEKIPESRILAELKDLNVGIGTFRLFISQDYLSNEMLQRIPELCWITVNVKGSHADVLVREAIEAPEIIDADTPTLVYAKKSGIITKITTYSGTAKCEPGDTVLIGDTLVTGEMDSVSRGKRYVHAMAKVYARTWYDMSAQMPLNVTGKMYTGEEITKNSVLLAGKRINLYLDSGIEWPYYDKITVEKPLRIFDGTVLPIKIVKDCYKEYNKTEKLQDRKEAENLLKNGLLRRLESKLLDGEIVEYEFAVTENDEIITVNMKAECIEQIAVMRDMRPDEMITEDTTDIEEES